MALMTLDKTYIISFWLEALLYGINFILACASLTVLTYKKERKEINKYLVAIIVTQYLLSTTDISLALIRVFSSDKFNGSPKCFSDLSNPITIPQLLFISLNSVVNDCVMAWRCYRVWVKNWKMTALPALLVIAMLLTCTIGLGISLLAVKDENNVCHSAMLWNGIFYGLTTFANVMGTLTIAFRIRSLVCTSLIGATYTKLVIFLTESGVLYSTFLLIGFGLYFSKNMSFFVVYQQLGQLSSIVSSMSLLLVGLKLTSKDLNVETSSIKFTIATRRANPFRKATAATRVRPVTITVMTCTEQYDTDYEFKVSSGDGDDSPRM